MTGTIDRRYDNRDKSELPYYTPNGRVFPGVTDRFEAARRARLDDQFGGQERVALNRAYFEGLEKQVSAEGLDGNPSKPVADRLCW